jgi:hypothetical protein
VTGPDGATGPRGEASAEPTTIHELAGRLETVESQIRTLAWGVTHETDELKRAVEELRARVDALDPPASPAEPPRAWVDSATAHDWRELATWVDWLIHTYDLQPSRAVLPCWPAHRGVAEELAALRAAWRAAAAKAGSCPTPNDALIHWHDRWLHPFLLRQRENFHIKGCQDGHKAVRPPRPTDPQLLAALVDAAERTADNVPRHYRGLTVEVTGPTGSL